nr:nucleic acid binding protein [Passiflora latent virus]
MRNLAIWRQSILVACKVQRSSVIIEMQTMGKHSKRMEAIIFSLISVLPIDICVCIALRALRTEPGSGRSSYARRRRAKAIGRCERCYRVYPPICNSKCDNKTCVPRISSNQRVVHFIKYGVT